METTHKQIVLGILAHVDSGKTTLSAVSYTHLDGQGSGEGREAAAAR